MATKNIIDVTSTTVTSDTPGKTLVLDNWATLSRAAVPCVLWVYAVTATVGDTGQVLLLDSGGATIITVDIDNGPGWYSGTGNLDASTEKYDVHFGNATGTLTVSHFTLLPLIT